MDDFERTGRAKKLARLGRLKKQVTQIEAELGIEPAAADERVRGVEAVDGGICSLVLEHSHDMISVHNPNGDYVWVGRNAKDILGFSPHDLIGKSAYEFFHPDDLDRIARDHADSIEGALTRVKYRIRHKDGSYRWVETRSYTRDDRAGKPQIAAITRDIHDEMMAREAALKADQVAQQRLEKLAHTDQLTGLANRLAAEKALRRERARLKRGGHAFSIGLIDIDHFKSVNDTFGHNLGDRVLKKVAQILDKQLREYDHAIRWGGEEFLAIMPEIDGSEAHAVMERVRHVTGETTFPKVGTVTISGGVAQATREETMDHLIGRADKALYQAKHKGRNQVVVADEE